MDDVINLKSNCELDVQKVKVKLRNSELDILNIYNHHESWSQCRY